MDTCGRIASILVTCGLTITVGCQGCVAHGMLVATPRGKRRIEDLEVGDEVLSVDPETGELVVSTIREIRRSERECVAIRAGSEGELLCTSDHAVYDPVAEEYAGAGEWVTHERDELLCLEDGDATRKHVDDVDSYAAVREVFDLTLDSGPRNFVAGGVVVHNDKRETCERNGKTVYVGRECTCPDGTQGFYSCESADGGETRGVCRCPDDSGTDTSGGTDADAASDTAETGDADGSADTSEEASDVSDGESAPNDGASDGSDGSG